MNSNFHIKKRYIFIILILCTFYKINSIRNHKVNLLPFSLKQEYVDNIDSVITKMPFVITKILFYTNVEHKKIIDSKKIDDKSYIVLEIYGLSNNMTMRQFYSREICNSIGHTLEKTGDFHNYNGIICKFPIEDKKNVVFKKNIMLTIGYKFRVKNIPFEKHTPSRDFL